ncbi:hypothetical protein CTAYLR_008078 [Chrysophaeum taylorii]|uniref:Exostosin GT47 domain-containing protein n=1 Tax=Chrysophaeum taylorii TaxID=2483200 RepID=A0AAD7UK36_9STRA|nr:hypothetical protein CTAYLR_008078 [Chrysophaeum taylorii]
MCASVVWSDSPLVVAYRAQREKVLGALGRYRFYVYAGPAVDAVTVSVIEGRRRHEIAEETAEVWVHRALLASSRRTLDPWEAEVFFVPAYLRLASRAKVETMLGNVTASPWFRRRGGRDHVFGYSSWNPATARQIGMDLVSRALPVSFRGAFEVNPAWVQVSSRDRESLDRIIAMPYVVDAQLFFGEGHSFEKDISVFFAARDRPNAIKWGNCDRSKAAGLSNLDDRASIHVHRRLVSMEKFASSMHRAEYCLVMCGDTPTSRRLFDAIVAGCVPLVVGTRLEGRCESPCKSGWGWFVSGPDHPHLPFHDIYVDYTVFPRVDEARFYENPRAAVRAALVLVSPQRHAHLVAYMREISDDLVYGYGHFSTSTHFGRAPANLMDTAVLRNRREDNNSILLRPDFFNDDDKTPASHEVGSGPVL